MKNKALYYPYINVPNEAWTYKTLLYWDSLLSIVPSSYIHNPDELEPFMLDLVRENLVEQVFPAEHLGNVENFDENFLNTVDKKYLRGKKSISNEYTKIHLEKLDSIARTLIDMELAVPSNGQWLFVEKNVANDFMVYLAGILSSKTDAVPVSDQMGNAKLYDKNQSFYNNKKRTKVQNTILDGVLPYPDGKISISELVKFKEKHHDLLPKFRKFIEEKSYDISQIEDKIYRKERTKEIITEIKDASLEIQDAMKPNFRRICFGSILPIFGASIGVYATDNNLATIGALAGLGGNIYSSLNQIDSELNKQPIAYIAHARRNLV
jgi:hypothetical protein